MTTDQKIQCSVHVYSYLRSRPCLRRAVVEREGRHYCGIHDPLRVTPAQRRAKVQYDRTSVVMDEGNALLAQLGVDGYVNYDRSARAGESLRTHEIVLSFSAVRELLTRLSSRATPESDIDDTVLGWREERE